MPNITTADACADTETETRRAPIRVLHLIGGNLYGGVETLLLTLAQSRQLCPGMDPHFAVCFEGRLSGELRAAGVPVLMLGNARISRPWTVWRARRRLRSVLANEHFDVVICHMAWTMAMFGATASAQQVKLVFWAHGFQSGRGWLERMARRVIPDLVISNSRATSSSISSLWKNSNNHLLYYPLAQPALPESGEVRARLRQEYGATDTTTVIIQVSRLEAWKGHRLHLRALSLLKDVPGWMCWFAGGPQNSEEESYFAELQRLAGELGISERVRFLGQRSDVRNLLAAADVFCQPNEGPEPFGLVFVEALWAGLPVVSTRLGGALEIIDDTCGLLAPPNDVASLADSLRSLIESHQLRRRLGRAGASRARQLCDPAQQMHRFEQLIRQQPDRNTPPS
jgi:glycosyltransferase involved in cell wall biosynthesis